MGALKRPKLQRGHLAEGAEFYYYRKPSTLPKGKRLPSYDEDSDTEALPKMGPKMKQRRSNSPTGANGRTRKSKSNE
jgi:hypothetical protein